VTDFFRQTFYFTIDECRTFYVSFQTAHESIMADYVTQELLQAIQKSCFTTADISVNDWQILYGPKDDILTSGKWPELLKREGSPTIILKLVRRASERRLIGISRSQQPSRTTKLIEQTAFNSSESDDERVDGKKTQFASGKSKSTKGQRTSTFPEPPHPNAVLKLGRPRDLPLAIRRLVDEGAVVNRPETLVPSSQRGRFTAPKLFVRRNTAPPDEDEHQSLVGGTEREPFGLHIDEIEDWESEPADDSPILDQYGAIPFKLQSIQNPASPYQTLDPMVELPTLQEFSSKEEITRAEPTKSRSNDKPGASQSQTHTSSHRGDYSNSDTRPTNLSAGTQRKVLRGASSGETAQNPTVESVPDSDSDILVTFEDSDSDAVITFESLPEQDHEASSNNRLDAKIRQSDNILRSPDNGTHYESFDPLSTADPLKSPLRDVPKVGGEERSKRRNANATRREASTGLERSEIEPGEIHPDRPRVERSATASQQRHGASRLRNITPTQPHIPTYPRVHMMYLEIDTLRYYGLPWQHDEREPDYIIILQELDTKGTEILFEHTRMLRANRYKPQPQPFPQTDAGRKANVNYRSDEPRRMGIIARENGQRAHFTNQDPTYIKSRIDYIDVETLRYFGLPWEYDRSDPAYIIILQEMENDEVEVLFEHTRKLKKGRERESSIPRYSPGRTLPLGTQSSPPDLNPINKELQVPPFLAWPVDEEEGDRQQLQSLDLTLTEIEYNLNKERKWGLPAFHGHPLATVLKGAEFMSNLPTKGFKDFGVLKEKISKAKDRSEPSIATSHLEPMEVWQISRIRSQVENLFSDVEALVNLFAPAVYPDKLLTKCWGSLGFISEVSHNIHEKLLF
jgi:hypothetical protein